MWTSDYLESATAYEPLCHSGSGIGCRPQADVGPTRKAFAAPSRPYGANDGELGQSLTRKAVASR